MTNPYNVQLLNDLHCHFPELLYNHTRFESVRDMLGYINSIVRLNPQHGAYHYYNQQYHARYHPQAAHQIYDEIYMGDEAPLLAGGRAHMASTAPLGSGAIGAPLGSGAIGAPLGSGAPLAQLLEQPLGQAAPLGQTAPLGSAAPLDQRNIRISSFIFGNVDMSQLFNQLLYGDAPINVDNLQNVTVVPTEEQLQNNTTVSQLSEDTADNCAICQDPLLEDQIARTLKRCQHMFHMDCIDTWFQRHCQCPCCRIDVREAVPESDEESDDEILP